MTELYHSFIADEAQVREFFRQYILPYRDEDYLNFIIIPIARRKYWAPLSKSQMNMSTKVFSVQDNEDRFVNELRRYEVKIGLYKDTLPVGQDPELPEPNKANKLRVDKEQDIPNEAFAFYLTANPMNDLKAFFLMQNEVSNKLQLLLNTKTPNKQKIGKISSIYKSCLHKSEHKVLLKLDVDTKDPDKIESLKNFLREHGIKPQLVIETRGGYHVLLNRSSLGKNHEKLYRFIQSSLDEKWISIEGGNALVVIPGTWQGGFVTRIVNFD